jgi:hypothetical protein
MIKGLFAKVHSVVAVLMLLFACNLVTFKDETEVTLQLPLKMSESVYFVAPFLDSSTVEASDPCDCCGSEILLMDESTFAGVHYCIESDLFFKGTYNIEGSKIYFHTDAQIIKKQKNWEAEADTSGRNLPDFVFIPDTTTPVSFQWTASRLNGKPYFLTTLNETPYASIRKDKRQEFITYLKQDSVWIQLNL